MVEYVIQGDLNKCFLAMDIHYLLISIKAGTLFYINSFGSYMDPPESIYFCQMSHLDCCHASV